MKQIIAIQDANILIDLIKLGLLGHCLGLAYVFMTTDIILEELYDEQVAQVTVHVQTGILTVIVISATDLAAIQQLSITHKKLSEQDCSALFYAEAKKAILLTGDNSLRNVAESKGITTCGIFWILDQLIEANKLSKKEACEKLEKLKLINNRLPKEEFEKRKKAWG